MNPLYIPRTVSLINSIIALYFSMLLVATLHATDPDQQGIEWPCLSRSAVEWIRHPKDCSRYFVCHSGQPVLMPGCPFGQVWSTTARNCVPKHSRWDDCSSSKNTEDLRGNLVTGDVNVKYHPVSVPSPLQPLPVPVKTVVKNLSPKKKGLPTPPASYFVKNHAPVITVSPVTSSPPMIKPVTRKPQPKFRKSGGTIRTRPTRNPYKEFQKKFQTISSPFQPSHPKKYYTYPRRKQMDVTRKPGKTPVRLPRPGNDPKRTRSPMKTPAITRQVITLAPKRTYVFPSFPSTRIKPTKISTQLRKKTPFKPTKIPDQIRKKSPFKPSKSPAEFRKKFPLSTRPPTRQTARPQSRQPDNPRRIPRPRLPPKFARPTPQPQQKEGLKPNQKPSKLIPRVPRPKARTTPKPVYRRTRRTSPKPEILKTPPPTSSSPTTVLTNQRRPPLMPKMSRATSTARPYSVRTVPTRRAKTKKTYRKRKGFGMRTLPPGDWADKPSYMKLPPGHPCGSSLGRLAAHPTQCHWYYNCTRAVMGRQGGADPVSLREECRYPQLFDLGSGRCREFLNVRCQDRFEPVDPCEYQANQCKKGSCVPCHTRFGACRDRANGIYPLHSTRWAPTFVTCYKERNIAQDDCQAPTPIFSPRARDCVALSEVPKENGGLRPECGYRQDGFYPDEQGRCGIFFECQTGNFVRYDECPLGTVFDPLTVRCQRLQVSTPPCGDGPAPSCANRPDGFHADPFGRCPYYFECRRSQFVQHHTCDFGSFDPLSQECVIPAEQMPRPCGLLPNPCEGKPSGFYPDSSSSSSSSSDCNRYLECFRGVLVTRATCPEGSLFSTTSKRCDSPDKAPESCRSGAGSCVGRPDGRYAAREQGCGAYEECREGVGVRRGQCRVKEGGWLFNPRTGQCDFPHNVCPPCGYRWWGCARRSVYRTVSTDSRRWESSTNITQT